MPLTINNDAVPERADTKRSQMLLRATVSAELSSCVR